MAKSSKLTSMNLRKGTVLEVLEDVVMPADKGDGAHVSASYLGGAGKVSLLKGEKYEVTKVSKEGGSAYVVRMSQVGGSKRAQNFLVFLAHLAIHSQPEVTPDDVTAGPTEAKLNVNEELVLVSKSDPSKVFKAIDDAFYASSSSIDAKNDVKVDGLVLSSKTGQRKKFKNIQTLYGFLNNASGCMDHNALYHYFNGGGGTKAEQFHLHAMDGMPAWVGGAAYDKGLKHLEVRKYDREARKVLGVAVEFDIQAYLDKYKASFNVTLRHGEAVSAVAGEIAQELGMEGFEKYPFVCAVEFDASKFADRRLVPREKDLYMELAIKQLGWKKKDLFACNKNGFAAVACKSKEDAQALMDAYKNEGRKVFAILEWSKLHPTVDLGAIARCYQGETPKDPEAETEAKTSPKLR